MKKSAYFTRISEKQAKEISSQVVAGVLSETENVLSKVEAGLTSVIPDEKQRKLVIAEVEDTLRKRGVLVKL